MFPIKNGLKQGDALSPMLSIFVLEYAIRRVQVNHKGLKLNTYQLIFYADDVNMLQGSVKTIKKHTIPLVLTSKETGLEVNAEKTKYMAISPDQNAGQNRNIKIYNKSSERVKQFRYFGTTLTNKNSIQEEIKSRLKSGHACYHSVQNPLSLSMLYKNIKLKMYRTITFPVVLYGCETWSFTMREEHGLRVFENRVQRKIFGPR
jgi:hypothetical protein